MIVHKNEIDPEFEFDQQETKMYFSQKLGT